MKAASPPLSLVALTIEELTKFLVDKGLPAYRARQVWKWVWQKGAVDYETMTDLPQEARTRLAAELPVTGLSVETVRRSKNDGTVKALLRTAGGLHIEAVAMPDEDSARLSVCVSTQAGCAMGCVFCASAAGGLEGNLSAAEILGQVLVMSRLADRRATGVVLMGMGDPLANYESSLAAVRGMNSPDRLKIGARHITVSTVGFPERIGGMAGEWPPVRLAVSLHAPDDELRRQLIPSASKWSITGILEAASAYAGATSRRFTAEYALIEGLNDSRSHAEELVRLLRRRPAKVNLIALNPGAGGEFKGSSQTRVRAFRDVLAGKGQEVTVRKRRGRDIEAACGQLRLRSGEA